MAAVRVRADVVVVVVIVVHQQVYRWRHDPLPVRLLLAHTLLHGLEQRELVVGQDFDQKIYVPVGR